MKLLQWHKLYNISGHFNTMSVYQWSIIIKALSVNKERAKCFLDEVIEPGLTIGYMDQFDEMLAVMMKSDDPPVRFLANEMKSRDIALPTPSQTLYELSLSPQARLKNAETQLQSKYVCMYLLTWAVPGVYKSWAVTYEPCRPLFLFIFPSQYKMNGLAGKTTQCMVSSFLGVG